MEDRIKMMDVKMEKMKFQMKAENGYNGIENGPHLGAAGETVSLQRPRTAIPIL